jgi:glycosyltransferase involved in cell wall biosynthesis
MNKNKVSVIMNCYNGVDYVEDAIESVIAQTYNNWELIFWDNKSTDLSSNVLKKFKDYRIKYYLSNEHTSQYEARRRAVLEAKGEFIAFLDVDDWWKEDKIEKQLKLFLDKDVGLATCNYWIVNERKKTKKLAFKNIPTGHVTEKLLKRNFVGMSTLIMKKDSYFSLEYGFDSRYEIIGDYDLILRLSKDNKLASLDEPYSYYRWHGKNLGFLKFELNISELSFWIKDKIEFSSYKNFDYLKNYILFYKGLIQIMNKKRISAMSQIYLMTSFYFRIKLSIVLCLPLWLIKKIRS